MSIKAGLVGLPNVGKSTLFNALTKAGVPAQNYPFCTIDPHIAITEVPDERLEQLKAVYQSKKIIPGDVMFVDIAGLVKGAASGEGLGNQFLSHIREVNLIIHVLRCFENTNILHTEDTIDPLRDYDTILQELMLKDLDSVEKRQTKIETLIKGAQSNPQEKKKLETEKTLLKEVYKSLDAMDVILVRQLIQDSTIETVPLLSAKDFLIVANIQEDDIGKLENNLYYQNLLQKSGSDRVIPLCIKIEEELNQLNDQEAQEMMAMIGLAERGLNTVIKKTYNKLNLITFFTCGPQEIHAWPIKKGMTIREASGEIHSDLQRGFICAEIVNCTDILTLKSEVKAKEAGKVRTEGQDYIVQDGDIIHVRFNV